MRLLIADDQIEVRMGLKILLDQEEQLHIAGEACDMNELLLLTQKLQPDILLLDWELNGQDMATVIPVLRSESPGTRIVAMSGRPEAKKQAALAGAEGFISKGNQPEKLLETIYNICPTNK